MQDIEKLTLSDMTAILEMADKIRKLLFGDASPKNPRSLYSGRALSVIDRGWIFAGDQELVGDHLQLTKATHVFAWESIGFPRMIEEWQSDKVDLRPIRDTLVPLSSIIFRIPVDDGWGRK